MFVALGLAGSGFVLPAIIIFQSKIKFLMMFLVGFSGRKE